MLDGSPVKAADEILAQVEAILRTGGKTPAYTVVAAIRLHGSILPDAKPKVLLLFPAVCRRVERGDHQATAGTTCYQTIDPGCLNIAIEADVAESGDALLGHGSCRRSWW
jgi:hypothetical protein